MNQLRLSVVIPNYNHAHFLSRAIKEVLNQGFSPYEIIIIDDCSTDESVKVIENIIKENPKVNIKFLQNDQNQGGIYSSNRGIREASGQYVYIAAADDTVSAGFFEDTMRLLAKYPQAGLCSSIVKIIYPDGNGICMPLKNPSFVECYLNPLECMRLLRKYDSWMGGNSCIYRRDVVLELGGFPSDLGAMCDTFIGMLVALKYGTCFIPKQLVGFRLMADSYSANFHSISNLDAELKIYSHAVNLMKTTYADLFPLDYADSWEKRMRYRARLSIVNQLYKHQVNVMNDIILKKNIVDNLLFYCIRLGMHLQMMILLFYFILRGEPELRIVLQRFILIKARYLKERMFHF